MATKDKIISNLSGLSTRILGKVRAEDSALATQLRSEIQTAIGNVVTFSIEVVESLPETGAAKTLYFVPSGEVGSNIYNEFIYIPGSNDSAGRWEQVGSTEYHPDHSITNNADLGKLVLTIGNNKYVIDRTPVVTPSTPQLKDGSDVVSDGDDLTNTKYLSLYCATSGAKIYYTKGTSAPASPIDESDPANPKPASGATEYTTAIEFAQNTGKEEETYYIKAAAFLNGAVSELLSIQVNIYRQVATPTFSVSAGTYNATKSVALTCTTDSADIYYTTDGSTPVPSEADQQGKATKTYSSEIAVNVTTTIKAVAVKSDWENSPVTTATYTLAVSAPTIEATGDQYDTSRTVTITKPSNATKLYYKKTGDSGWSETTNASASITLSAAGSYTIEAKGTKDGWSDATASQTYAVGTLYTHAGLSSASAASNVTLSELTVLDSGNTKKQDPAGAYAFTNNSGSDKYIWFAVPSDRSIKEILAGAVPQDVEEPQTVGNYKFYRMSGALINGKSILLNVTV